MQRRFSLILLSLMAVSAPLFAAPKTGSYALVLQDAPAAKARASKVAPPSNRRAAPEVEAARQQIRQKQSALKSNLKAAGFAVTGSTDTLLNAVFVRADKSDVATLRAMPGVKAVVFLPHMHLQLNAAVNLLDAPNAWNILGGVGSAGAGIKIAIIDTGIDQTHPAFQDPTLSMPTGFPICDTTADCAFTNNKVIVARSYVALAEAANAVSGESYPQYSTPDDVSARDRVGHGTAVAMCAGGNTNTGPLGTITGLAPKAYLGNYKVYGSPGIIDFLATEAFLQAMDDAFNDGMDIVSFSSGGPAFSGPLDTGTFCEDELGASECDVTAYAVETAVSQGMTVVTAAGNSGQSGDIENSQTSPSYTTVGSPAYAPDSIAVAASGNSHMVDESVQVNGPGVPSTLQNIPALEDDSPVPPSGILTATLIDAAKVGDGYACSAFPSNSMTGDIALIERGPVSSPCTFAAKLENAESAGAVGVLFFNDGAAGPDVISPDTSESDQGIPAFFIGTSNGQAVKTYVDSTSGVTVGLDPFTSGFTDAIDSNQVTFFSSRGPSLGGGLKPDVDAPGENIYMAAQSYDPNGELYDPTGYTVADGTSFSTPMVAGIAALVKQYHGSYTPGQIKSAIVNTATADTTDPYVAFNGSPSSVLSVGGGKAEATYALQTDVTVEPASLSLGVFGPTTVAFAPSTPTLTVTNQSTGSLTLTLSVTRRNPDSATQITLSPATLTLAAGQQRTVTVSFTGSAPAAGIYEGAVNIAGGSQALHVPYLYIMGDGVPAQLYSIAGDEETGTVGMIVPDSVSAFQVIDQYGVPVANLPVAWSASAGGSVSNYDSVTNMYGEALATTTLGTTPGSYNFTANISGFTSHTFQDAARALPVINSGGVVNAASNAVGNGIAPGSYISLYGVGLADSSGSATTSILPIAINYTSVGFDATNVSVPGALLYVGANQVNVQVPWELAGQSSVQMKVNIEPTIGQLITIPVTTYSPAFFVVNGIGAAEDLSGNVITASHAAVRGNYISLYGTGLGPVTNQPATGNPALSNPLSNTTTLPTLTVGGQSATVSFAGLAPGYPGLYQLNVQIPTGIAAGTQPVALTINGVAAPVVNLPVQ